MRKLSWFQFLIASLFAGGVVRAQTPHFTYQGRLTTSNGPATGLFDLTFRLHDTPGGGAPLTQQFQGAVPVTNGLFTTTVAFDLAHTAFPGDERWLELQVRPAGENDWTTLLPRQRLTSVPYASRANSAGGLSGTALISGPASFSPGAGQPPFLVPAPANNVLVTNLNADLLDGKHAADFWQLQGNSGTTPGTNFLGTTDDRALEIKVAGTRALRIEPSAAGPANLIGGYLSNSVSSGVAGAVISGGGKFDGANGDSPNQVQAGFSTIGGGHGNTIAEPAGAAVIAGGVRNIAVSPGGVISGGEGNRISTGADFAVISGGNANIIGADSERAVISGGEANGIGSGSGHASIGGGSQNFIESDSQWAAIGGGGNNLIGANSIGARLGGGEMNAIETFCYDSVLGGGLRNRIGHETVGGVLGGGLQNQIQANFATLSGGAFNRIETGAEAGVVAGGNGHRLGTNASHSVIGGGLNNVALGQSATVSGGAENLAAGAYSSAGGHRAKAQHAGAFVWGDSSDADVGSTTNDQFIVRASGGAKFFSNSNLTAGVSLAPGGGSWSMVSDRGGKANVQAVNADEVLEKVVTLPMATWNYRTQTPDIRHLGPMAQDFHAAFGLGENDTTINSVDAHGVALAAIQGLNGKVEAELKIKDARIAALEKTVSELKATLDALTQMQKGAAR